MPRAHWLWAGMLALAGIACGDDTQQAPADGPVPIADAAVDAPSTRDVADAGLESAVAGAEVRAADAPAADSSAGDGSSAEAGATDASAGDSAPDASAVPVNGAFVAELKAPPPPASPFTNLWGKVYDGPTPAMWSWETLEQAAGCRVVEPQAPFCDPPCAGGQVCLPSNRCAAHATAQDLGPLTVSGLPAGDVRMEAVGGNYTAPTLPSPPAPEGTELRISSAGGPYGVFTVRSKSIAPLTVTSGMLVLESGKPLQLDWQAAQADVARVAVTVDISHHGGVKGLIECDVPDSGSLQIPAPLVTRLVGLGVAGFPQVSVKRIVVGSTPVGAGKISFEVSSEVIRDLTIPGITSCLDDGDCPVGKKCQGDKTCER